MNAGSYTIQPPKGFVTGDIGVVNNYVSNIISLLMFIGVFLAVIYLIIGAIKFMASGGEKQAKAAARSQITYALIGLLLLFASFVILNMIGAFWGVDLITGSGRGTPSKCLSNTGEC